MKIDIIVKPELKHLRLTLASDGRVTLKVRSEAEGERFMPLARVAHLAFGVPEQTLRGCPKEVEPDSSLFCRFSHEATIKLTPKLIWIRRGDNLIPIARSMWAV